MRELVIEDKWCSQCENIQMFVRNRKDGLWYCFVCSKEYLEHSPEQLQTPPKSSV